MTTNPPTDLDRRPDGELELFTAELHDGVLQYLVAASMAVEVLKRDAATSGASVDASKLEELSTLIQSGLEAGRRLISGARSIDFSDESPQEFLIRTVAEAEASSGIRFEKRIELSNELPLAVANVVCRVTSEAITNLIRHSGAAAARVSIEHENGEVVIIVSDDGCGFDPQASRIGHFGIDFMRQRVESLDGRFRVESQDGEGTRLEAHIPSSITD